MTQKQIKQSESRESEQLKESLQCQCWEIKSNSSFIRAGPKLACYSCSSAEHIRCRWAYGPPRRLLTWASARSGRGRAGAAWRRCSGPTGRGIWVWTPAVPACCWGTARRCNCTVSGAGSTPWKRAQEKGKWVSLDKPPDLASRLRLTAINFNVLFEWKTLSRSDAGRECWWDLVFENRTWVDCIWNLCSEHLPHKDSNSQ